MAAEPVLKLIVVSFTTDQLAIKVKNISTAPLDKTLVIQFYPPLYLVNDEIGEAAQSIDTLAAGAEDIFVHDYKPKYPTAALTPYVARKRKFTVKCEGFTVGPIGSGYSRDGVSQFISGVPAEIPSLPTKSVDEFSFELTYNDANPAPATIQLFFSPEQTFRPDVSYLLRLHFSGRDLGRVSSSFTRLAIVMDGLKNHIMDGTETLHSGDKSIVVRRPKRFEERVRFVIINSAKQFGLYTKLTMRGQATPITGAVVIVVDHELMDFSVFSEGGPTPGTVRVNFNFAMPNGIEVSPASEPQTKLIRITNDQAKNIKIKQVKMLLPNDPPLIIPGHDPVNSMPDQTVLVCELE